MEDDAGLLKMVKQLLHIVHTMALGNDQHARQCQPMSSIALSIASIN